MVKFILSVSGGGVRGAAAAECLATIEDILGYRPQFDLLAGTSTGSLIVGALAYTDMTTRQISDNLYTSENATKLMPKSKWDRILGLFQNTPKYPIEPMKEFINNMSQKSFGDTPHDVMVTALNIDNYKPVVFKSFEHKDKSLTDVLCMSCSCPGYYPTYFSDFWGIDGGFTGMNNPSECAYAEALILYPKEEIRVLSLGTGSKINKPIGSESQHFGGVQWMTRGNIIDVVLSGPQKSVEYKMKSYTKALGHTYLHIDGYLDDITLDDTSKENIHRLKEAGRDWANEHRDSILEFFKVD